MTCILKILFTFVLVKSIIRVCKGPVFSGHFLCSLQYGGGFLSCRFPVGPNEGLDSERGHRFLFVPMSKTSLKMKNVTGVSAQVAISADEIIKKLFDSDFTDDLRTDLREMIDAYLLSEDETDYRDQRHSSFLWIDSLLKDIKTYHAQSQIKLVS